MGIEPRKTNQRITTIAEENSPIVGMLKDVPSHLDDAVVKIDLRVVEGSPYDVIVRDPTMYDLKEVNDTLDTAWSRL